MSKPESQRLQEFYDFDQDVLATIEVVADRQRQQSFDELNATIPENLVFYPISGKPVEILDTGLNDNIERTLAYHMMMGTGLDTSQRARLATLAAAMPNTRIIAVGNPGGPGNHYGKLPLRDIPEVIGGDLRATIDPALQYVNSQGIEVITNIGGSFGGEKASTASIYSQDYDINPEQTIVVDPAAVYDRKFLRLQTLGIIRLGLDFKRSEKGLAEAVNRTNSPAYFEARRLSNSSGHGLAGYAIGLLRASNVSSAQALSNAYFEGRMGRAMTENPEMRGDMVWATDSELAINGFMLAISSRLIKEYGEDRTSAAQIRGQRHAMLDDIFLHAAIMLQTYNKLNK